MSDRYPTLRKMGIENPDQIASYSVLSDYPNKDILRIKYRRPPGSLLPVTRSYEFNRTPRAADSQTSDGDLISHEVSEFLNVALIELEGLVRAHGSKDVLVEDVLAQLEDIEREFIGELAGLKAKLKQLRGLA